MSAPQSFGVEKNPQFQWHVEPGESKGLACDFGARNVVDTVITLGNQPIDIFDPHFGCIRQFQCTSGHESTCRNAKDNRVEKRLILFIERTIDENAGTRCRWHPGLTVLNHQEHVLVRAGSYPLLVRFRIGSL